MGEWRRGGANAKKAAAGLLGVQVRREMAQDNEHSRRAMALIASLRAADQSYHQLNAVGFSTPLSKHFVATQARRLYLRIGVAPAGKTTTHPA